MSEAATGAEVVELHPSGDQNPEDRLGILLENAKDLPTIPKIAVHVAKLVDNPNTSASQVATALASDQILTARVLRMANSAFYGAPRRISTVTDAIVLLGMRTIRNMAMAVSCFDVLDRELQSYAMRRGDMWRHAFCVGYAAQLLAKRTHYRATEEAFVAGLMHDIGKVVVSLSFAEEFKAVLDLAAASDMPFYMAERQVLGFDHAEVGARVTESWKLPQQLVETIRYHHMPGKQPEWAPLTAIVHVADVLCLTLGIGIGKDGMRYTLEDGIMERLSLTQDGVEEVMILIADFVATSDMMR
jgi:putative nucleotidyltransferase with HDIG domain